MVRDALRSYLSLATGLVDVPRQQAVRVAKALVSQGEATAEQAGSIADDLIGTSRANRDALVHLIRHEVDRGLTRLGLAGADEVRVLRDQVAALEKEVAALRAQGSGTSGGSRAGAAAAKRGGAGRSGSSVSAPAKRTTASRKAAGSGTASGSAKSSGARKASGGSKASQGGTDSAALGQDEGSR